VGGSLEVEGDSAPVNARDIKGNATIRSSYKNILVERVDGWLDIDTNSSPVTVSDIKQHVDITTSYKPIQVKNIGGDLEIDGSSCSVTAEDIGGDVDIRNSYKYVILRQTSGSIVVSGSSSPIEVSSIKRLPADGEIELITTYKKIQLALPEDADVTISASTRYGRIRSDFPVYLDSEDDKKIEVKLGKGRTMVRLETSGNIILKKE
jgi:hypothetical protein